MKKSKLLMPLAGIAAIGAVAPIAIMATSCNKGAQASETDKAFLTKINGYMKYGEEYCSPHKAIEALKNNGCDVVAYKLSNIKLEFAFDAAAKKFIIMSGDAIAAAPDGYKMDNAQVVFKFTNKYDKNSKYGQYLLDEYEWTDPTKPFEVTGSIDVGNNTNIKYVKYAPTTNADSKTILVRTYCEYLVFAENNDTIYHMGESNNIEVYGQSATSPCNYMELGRTAYLYTKNTTFDARKINTIDSAQIDVLDADVGTTLSPKFNESTVTIETGEKLTGFKKYHKTAPVATAAKFWEAIDAGEVFIRLTADIEFDGQAAEKTIAIEDKTFILDLGGKKIIDKTDKIAKGGALFSVQAKTKDSTIMFIDSYRQGELQLNDHIIQVLGDSTNGHTASAYLEGANISYDVDDTAKTRKGAIEVGDSSVNKDEQFSRVYMFGGKITATTTAKSHETEASGIYAKNNAYVQVVYGSIVSSVNCIRGNGSYENIFIDLVNANLKTKNSDYGMCIFMPNGKLNITGGTYEGHCCIGIRGGNTTISGGYFHATGDKDDTLEGITQPSGIKTDGSVICVELTDHADGQHYAVNPSLTIHNATLQSDKAYVVNIYDGVSPLPSPSTEPAQKFEADFFGGMYYYAVDVASPTYNGIRIVDKTYQYRTPRIYQQSGQWIKTK